MRKLIIITILTLIQIYVFAQDADEFKNKGFFNLSKVSYHFVDKISYDMFIPTQGGFNYDIEESNSMAVGAYTINGWFVFPWLSAGVGLGYEYQNTMNFHLLPVYFDLRTYLSKGENAIYLFADYGIVAGLNKNVGTGEMLNIGIGYKFFIKNYCFTAGLDFNSYTLLDVSGYPEPDPVHDFSVSSTAISIGILF